MIPLWLKIAGPIALLLAVITGGKLYIAHIDRTARAEQKAADEAVVKAAQLEAKAKDLENARATEAARAQGTKDANDALYPQLADARSRLAAYAARLRNQAAQGGGDRADMPSVASAADVADGADPLSQLDDDLDRCTEAVVRLKNAQDWWAAIPQE